MDDQNNNELEMEDELEHIMVLNDENGEEKKFEFLDLIELDSEEYVVLLPVEEEEEDADDIGEVVILKVENPDSEDEVTYIGIEDEDTLNKVFQIFKDKFSDEFDFVD